MAVAELARKIFRIPTAEDRLAKEQTRLDSLWNRQVNRFLELGFNQELNLTPEEYKESFPKFSPLPDDVRRRYRNHNLPVLVEKRIPTEKQARMVNLPSFYDDKYFHKTKKVVDLVSTSEKPYAIWTHNPTLDPLLNSNSSVQELESRHGIEKLITAQEALSFYIQYPEMVDFINAAGSRIISDDSDIFPNNQSIPRIDANFRNERATFVAYYPLDQAGWTLRLMTKINQPAIGASTTELS